MFFCISWSMRFQARVRVPKTTPSPLSSCWNRMFLPMSSSSIVLTASECEFITDVTIAIRVSRGTQMIVTDMLVVIVSDCVVNSSKN